jgi:hypothetical protein
MNFFIGAILELILMVMLGYSCYLLYGHWRRRGTNTEKLLFAGSVIIVCIYPFMLLPYITGVEFTGLLKDLDDYADYLFGSTILLLLIYAFKQVEHHELNLEMLVEEKSRRLIESERLANIGRGVVQAEQEIRNPLILISQAAYIAAQKKALNPEIIRIIGENVEKINDILAELRKKSGLK